MSSTHAVPESDTMTEHMRSALACPAATKASTISIVLVLSEVILEALREYLRRSASARRVSSGWRGMEKN